MVTHLKIFTFSVILAAASAPAALANPQNKLCRGTTAAYAVYDEHRKDLPAASDRMLCLHVGRLLGGIEENMTFKNRSKVEPRQLALADEMVDRANSLRSFCGGTPTDGAFESGVRDGDRLELDVQLRRIFAPSGAATKLQTMTCDE